MQIEIPFKEQFGHVMQNGHKKCTSRTKRYGNVGDHFFAFARHFELTAVERWTLQDIKDRLYYQEGFDLPVEFMDCWVDLHPRNEWQPHKRVWVHFFKLLGKQQGPANYAHYITLDAYDTYAGGP